jgi:hypothetical protein
MIATVALVVAMAAVIATMVSGNSPSADAGGGEGPRALDGGHCEASAGSGGGGAGEDVPLKLMFWPGKGLRPVPPLLLADKNRPNDVLNAEMRGLVARVQAVERALRMSPALPPGDRYRLIAEANSAMMSADASRAAAAATARLEASDDVVVHVSFCDRKIDFDPRSRPSWWPDGAPWNHKLHKADRATLEAVWVAAWERLEELIESRASDLARGGVETPLDEYLASKQTDPTGAAPLAGITVLVPGWSDDVPAMVECLERLGGRAIRELELVADAGGLAGIDVVIDTGDIAYEVLLVTEAWGIPILRADWLSSCTSGMLACTNVHTRRPARPDRRITSLLDGLRVFVAGDSDFRAASRLVLTRAGRRHGCFLVLPVVLCRCWSLLFISPANPPSPQTRISHTMPQVRAWSTRSGWNPQPT